MKRYFQEVKNLDSGKIDINEFVKKVINYDNIDFYILVGVFLIYKEDGGKMTKEEFFNKAKINLSEEDKRFFNDFIKEIEVEKCN